MSTNAYPDTTCRDRSRLKFDRPHFWRILVERVLLAARRTFAVSESSKVDARTAVLRSRRVVTTLGVAQRRISIEYLGREITGDAAT